MAESLADEILAQILDQVLAFDDEDYSSCADYSPFETHDWSSTNTLLVCKRWMRVGTPTLYHTIVIQSNRQANRLARTLKKSRLGIYIRKLRLEGWFGKALTKIFEASVNMTDICFQTTARTKHSVDSFCSSIGSLSVQRVIIWKSDRTDTKPWVRVRQAVDEWLPSIANPVGPHWSLCSASG